MSDTKEIAPSAVSGIRFPVASRPMIKYSAKQTVSNAAAGTSLQPISLPPVGFVRKVSLLVEVAVTMSAGGALAAGDGPFNLISNVALSDATGQAIITPISGYNLYLLNKYFPAGSEATLIPRTYQNPHQGPEYAYAATATTGTAKYRLDIDLEQDSTTGYGCLPNLDANASPQLRIDVAPASAAFAGAVTTSTVTVTVDQHFWAPVGDTTGGVPNQKYPVGYGDFVETRYENTPVSASSENTIPLSAKGGYVKGVIFVSRAAGVRTAFPAAANAGYKFDNNGVFEGVRMDTWQDMVRRTYGFMGADVGTSYAPLGAGIPAGLDVGVHVLNFDAFSAGGRQTWLPTRPGSFLQAILTPGAAATQLEILTQIAQVKDSAAFYGAE